MKEISKNKTKRIIFHPLKLRQQSKTYFCIKKKLNVKEKSKNKTKKYILTTQALDSNQKVSLTNKNLFTVPIFAFFSSMLYLLL